MYSLLQNKSNIEYDGKKTLKMKFHYNFESNGNQSNWKSESDHWISTWVYWDSKASSAFMQESILINDLEMA